MIENALVSGVTFIGSNTIIICSILTPKIAFITTNLNTDAGIVVSASHNPYEDNGVN